MAWNLSCPDWRDRLQARRSLIPDLPLFQGQADAALAVFRSMHVADMLGTPTVGELGDDWVADLVRVVFGSVDPETNRREVRQFFTMVPKKNAKTTGSALLMLTALLVNRRRRAKFLLFGPTHDAALLAFAAAEGAIKSCPVKSAKLHVRDHLKRIEHRISGAALEIMTWDPQVITGQKPAGALVDELHICAQSPKAASALRQLRGGMLAIPEAFLIMITTQSEAPPVGIFAQELRRARNIRDGVETGDMLPILYEFPEEMQRDRAKWMNPATWPMVNPNWGRSVNEDALLSLYRNEAANGEAALRGWASQHLNVEIGVGLRSDAWRGAEYWEQAAEPGLTLEALLDRCEVVTVGIDGGGLDDMLGLAVLGRERATLRWLHWGRAWLHESALELRKSEVPAYLDFQAAGDLIVVDDLEEAYGQAADLVARIHDAGLLDSIGFDPAGIGAIIDALAVRGIPVGDRDGSLTFLVGQGWMLNGPIKTAEVKLANGTLVHAGQKLMAYAAGNARIEPRGNAVVVTKAASGTAKIDPLMALFDAVARMIRNPEARGPSVYEAMGEEADATPAAQDGIDADILADPRHPQFEEMRERWYRARELEWSEA